jgi:hypothetical protein
MLLFKSDMNIDKPAPPLLAPSVKRHSAVWGRRKRRRRRRRKRHRGNKGVGGLWWWE